MNEDFYVYLPSNTEFLHSNRSYKYVTKLAREISLTGRWQVCLKEIHYPKSWATLTPYECSFVVMRGDTWREVNIDSGYYISERTLVENIHKAIKESDITIGFSPSSRRMEISIPPGCSIHFSEPLSSMLGIGNGNVTCTSEMSRGLAPINMSQGIDVIYVYTDIVQTKLVGDTSLPLFTLVPVEGEYGKMVFREYAAPIYTNLSKNIFSTIEIYLMDSGGRNIPFEFGKVTVLLHFKKHEVKK